MNKSLFLLASMFVVTFANAQKLTEKEVPSPAKDVVLKNYPAAKEVKWEKEDGNYEAEFKVKETEYSLVIDAMGNILETEVEIKVPDLPAKAKEYLSKNFAGQKIKEAAKITDSKGIVTYEAELKGKELLFDSNGNLIKQKEHKEEKEDSDND